jgi:hypothetical protein
VQSRAVLATLRQSVAEMESVRSRLQDYGSLMARVERSRGEVASQQGERLPRAGGGLLAPQSSAQQLLALLGALAALRLGATEEVGQLAVAFAFSVLDVGLQS